MEALRYARGVDGNRIVPESCKFEKRIFNLYRRGLNRLGEKKAIICEIFRVAVRTVRWKELSDETGMS